MQGENVQGVDRNNNHYQTVNPAATVEIIGYIDFINDLL